MTTDLGLELGRLLDQYDAKRAAVEERRQQVKTAEDTFEKGFADVRSSVVRPVFEEIGAILKARGHDFSISEDEYAGELGGKANEAAIAMHVMPAGMEKSSQTDAQYPSLTFVTRRYNKTVCIRASNAAPKSVTAGSPRGDYQLAQINRELVQAELMNLIAGIVNR